MISYRFYVNNHVRPISWRFHSRNHFSTRSSTESNESSSRMSHAQRPVAMGPNSCHVSDLQNTLPQKDDSLLINPIRIVRSSRNSCSAKKNCLREYEHEILPEIATKESFDAHIIGILHFFDFCLRVL